MKMLGKTLLIMGFTGVALMATGLLFNADTSLYIDGRGMHFDQYSDESYSINNPEIYEGFTDIEIDTADSEITIIPAEHYGFEITGKNSENITHSLKSGRLKITERPLASFRIFNFDVSTHEIKVFIPKDAKINNVNINSASRSITIEELNCKDLDITMASGYTNISDSKAVTLSINSASGNINLENLTADKCDFRMLSGDLDGDEIETNGLSLDLASGNAELSGKFTGDSIIKMASGDVHMDIDGKEQDYSRTTNFTSGDFYVNGEKVSAGYNYKDAPNSLHIEALSGSAHINFSH